jgi:hypothetical protein
MITNYMRQNLRSCQHIMTFFTGRKHDIEWMTANINPRRGKALSAMNVKHMMSGKLVIFIQKHPCLYAYICPKSYVHICFAVPCWGTFLRWQLSDRKNIAGWLHSINLSCWFILNTGCNGRLWIERLCQRKMWRQHVKLCTNYAWWFQFTSWLTVLSTYVSRPHQRHCEQKA